MKSLLLFLPLLSCFQSNGQSITHSDTNYYDNGAIKEILAYHKHLLVNHVAFNESGALLYQSPLMSMQKIPNFKFVSGRIYFDSVRLDTIVFDNNIPQMNLNVYFPGATILRISAYSFAIRSWKPQPNTQKGKMVIDIFENVFTKSSNVLHKVVFIDIK
jgi:hypothetical protein